MTARDTLQTNQDILLALGGWLVLALLVLAGQEGFLLPLQAALGLAYVLFVPGYCLTAALFPRKDHLDPIERLGLSLGLSVAQVPLLALILSWLPWGVSRSSTVFGIGALILGLAAVMWWRRVTLPPESYFAPLSSWQPRRLLSNRIVRGPRRWPLAWLLVVSLGAAVLLVSASSPDRFATEFYMFGRNGRAEGFPRSANQGEEMTVTIGVANREVGDRAYRVEVWVNDSWQPERRALVARVDDLTLARGRLKEWPIAWRMPWSGNDQRVDLHLFVDGNAEPYRTLRLWVDVAPPPAG